MKVNYVGIETRVCGVIDTVVGGRENVQLNMNIMLTILYTLPVTIPPPLIATLTPTLLAFVLALAHAALTDHIFHLTI